MYRRQASNARYPSDTAIGVGADGKFKTSAHKEYPPQLCDALAGTIVDELHQRQARGLCTDCTAMTPDLLNWLNEAASHCGVLREGAGWLPDEQGAKLAKEMNPSNQVIYDINQRINLIECFITRCSISMHKYRPFLALMVKLKDELQQIMNLWPAFKTQQKLQEQIRNVKLHVDAVPWKQLFLNINRSQH
eukprot:s1067_g7.t1